ncbi:MAG: VanZ family protein [Oscillospiraceae bacterium]|nr:VanZ family protein [Oscillospiraceae bacterium]
MIHILCYSAAGLVNLVWLLLGDRLGLLLQVAAPAVTVLLAGTGVFFRLQALPQGARPRYLRGALWALFLYYLAILSVLLFFGGLFQLDRVWGGSVNLKPFHTIRSYLRFYRSTGSPVSVMNLLGNVVIMVPLGMLLPILFRTMRHFWTCLPLCALTAVGVEWLQWATATGAADVDDSILNFLGAALGYLLVRLCQMAAERRKNR